MQVLFVGGADSVGASCLAIELANQWFVVDAGVRVDHRSDPLPDLSLLEGKAVKAIFVTHAHADHIGALPLVHQAFPTVPIYTSRGTALLMEVMLADAVRVMERRAIEEMELPHYPGELVARMLNLVRPLPIDTPITVPELSGITIQASRAGHIAGAVSLGFESSDGSLVVSGDISITEQRTVLGAVPPPVKQPDLLILESTYGARLHANRQAEEARFAQAVADGIARGGHVLIPAFGLGRGQEVLLILQDAILKQQIAPFPIYVDGLVRRVCSTYLLLPEALSPRLGRQIRRGFQPFTNKVVSFVGDVRERERILAASPACIVSSSGMLTGGPSVWYAARLATRPEASILITGYQDEESPGKRLLDVAEHRRDTLELDGQTVPVACHVAKYSLSAHADGGELATYAAALAPRHVALVHGDEEARAALRIRLTNTEVFLPRNGTPLSFQHTKARRGATITESTPLSRLPRGIGGGLPLTLARLEQLWKAVAGIPTLRIVTARELALVWYGEATEETTEQLLDVLVEDARQRYFVPQHALEEAFRVRGGIEEMSSDILNDFVGQVLFIQVAPESAKPAVCRELLPPASLRVWLPKGEMERTRFPTSAILDVLGPLPPEIEEAVIPGYLSSLMRQARSIRRPLSARTLASLCHSDRLSAASRESGVAGRNKSRHEGSIYSLSELCSLLSVSPDDLATRLAVAKLVQRAPHLFALQQSALASDGQALYTLAPTWEEALAEPEEIEERVLPDQHALLGIVEQYLGNPPDLYRRSVDPESGRITLAFYFPAIAQEYYGEAIEAAAEEAGVEITLTEQPHQGALAQVASEVLPEGLQATKAPSIYHDYQEVQVECVGTVSAEEIASAEERFLNETGWRMRLNIKNITPLAATTVSTPPTPSPTQDAEAPSIASEPAKRLWGMTEALQYAQRLLIPLSGYQRVRVEAGTHTLILRFTFPDVARVRYEPMAAQIKETTGWNVRFHPTVHQEALVELADRLLPEGLTRIDAPSIFHTSHQMSMMCTGKTTSEAMQTALQKFLEETGWQLKIVGATINA